MTTKTNTKPAADDQADADTVRAELDAARAELEAARAALAALPTRKAPEPAPEPEPVRFVALLDTGENVDLPTEVCTHHALPDGSVARVLAIRAL